MPQPALHLLMGRQKLARWATTRGAPFDIEDPAAVNAFLHGTLAPDMGNFPGGSSELAHAVHTERTGDVVRGLMRAAVTPAETAFAWGWLSHVLADVEIHPLVNASALRRSHDSTLRLSEHVRVEVGMDVWFCCENPLLDGLRLRPAFDQRGYAFLRDVLNESLSVRVTTTQLTRMERGLMIFSHAALRFARGAARQLSWRRPGPRPTLGDRVVWHAATRISAADSVVHAYLKPYLPDDALIHETERAIARVHSQFHHCERAGLDELPSVNLEDGSLLEPVQNVA